MTAKTLNTATDPREDNPMADCELKVTSAISMTVGIRGMIRQIVQTLSDIGSVTQAEKERTRLIAECFDVPETEITAAVDQISRGAILSREEALSQVRRIIASQGRRWHEAINTMYPERA